ncbi:hypothetical protein C5167_027061 [Papaver somniferum]|nr:hypothetical protein C5167_027061 [Papaver somniferum]
MIKMIRDEPVEDVMEGGEVDVENNNEDDASDGRRCREKGFRSDSGTEMNKEGLGNGIESAVIDRDSQGELKWTWWYKRCYVRYRECLCYDAEKKQAATVNSNKNLKMVILRMGLLEEIGNNGGVTLQLVRDGVAGICLCQDYKFSFYKD